MNKNVLNYKIACSPTTETNKLLFISRLMITFTIDQPAIDAEKIQKKKRLAMHFRYLKQEILIMFFYIKAAV